MDWIRDHLWETWLALSIVLGVAEMFSLDLILAMLAAGAVIGMVAALIGLPIVVQILARARPPPWPRCRWCGRRSSSACTAAPSWRSATASWSAPGAWSPRRSPASTPGRIKAGGETWTALPYDENLRIAAGETVEILQIKGATAYVHPVASLES